MGKASSDPTSSRPSSRASSRGSRAGEERLGPGVAELVAEWPKALGMEPSLPSGMLPSGKGTEDTCSAASHADVNSASVVDAPSETATSRPPLLENRQARHNRARRARLREKQR